jgi:hypothetical protein
MRKQESIFNSFAEFINRQDVGGMYRTRDMHKEVSGNTERRAKYQTVLKRTGFISHLSRGVWEVERAIPEWFTVSHAETLLGYSKYVVINGVHGSARRTKMTKEEILAKLNETPWVPAEIRKVVKERKKPLPILAASATGFLSDLLSLERETLNANQVPKSATVKKISPEESTFYKQPEQYKYSAQLQENLMMNIGYINSALAIIDQTEFLDPVLHARTINIFVQLKDLHRTIEGRIEYKRTIQNL